MTKQPFTKAIRPLAGLCNSSAARSARPFSSTSSYGLRAVFTETENPELNQVLNNIQEKIILPAHLPEKQRKLILDPKKRNFIQQNPIVIELDGLEHKFSFIDRFKELPNTKKILFSALELMKTKEDWENLGTLLAGYKKAGVKLFPFHYSKMIRRAGRNGQIFSIIECAKQAPKTGFDLTQDTAIIQLLTFISLRRPAEAVKWNDIVLDLLQREPHTKDGRTELHPLVLGQILFSQASDVQSKIQENQPVEKETAVLTDRVEHLSKWWTRQLAEDSSLPASVTELVPFAKPESKQTLATLNGTEFVQVVALNIKAMSLAGDIVSDAAKGLEPVRQMLEAQLRDFVEQSSTRYRATWIDAYEQITGKKPEWSVPTQPAAEP